MNVLRVVWYTGYVILFNNVTKWKWPTCEAFSFPATAGTIDRNLLNSTCLTWRRYLRIMAFALCCVGLPCGLLRLLSARILQDDPISDESVAWIPWIEDSDDIDDLWEHVGFNRSANAKFIFGWRLLLVFGLDSIRPNDAIFVFVWWVVSMVALECKEAFWCW